MAALLPAWQRLRLFKPEGLVSPSLTPFYHVFTFLKRRKINRDLSQFTISCRIFLPKLQFLLGAMPDRIFEYAGEAVPSSSFISFSLNPSAQCGDPPTNCTKLIFFFLNFPDTFSPSLPCTRSFTWLVYSMTSFSPFFHRFVPDFSFESKPPSDLSWDGGGQIFFLSLYSKKRGDGR
ncbi:MAG: hypothetical protein AAGN35_05315 [Bacteroidota bacterium]